MTATTDIAPEAEDLHLGPKATDPTSDSDDSAGEAHLPRFSADTLKLALVGLVVLVAVVLGLAALRSGEGDRAADGAADTGALSVIAEDIVTSAKDDGGAIDAIGGYLPGTGMVLTVKLADTDTDSMAQWVSRNLDPFAETLAIMPSNESIIVTITDAGRETARVWSLPVEALGTSERNWTQLVAPASFQAEPAVVADTGRDDTASDATAASEPAASASAPAPTIEVVAEDTASSAPMPTSATEPTADPNHEIVGIDDAAVPAAAPTAGTGRSALVGTGIGGDAFGQADAWSPIFGSWVLDDGVYAQSDATGYGYAATFGPYLPDTYDVSVSMRAPRGDLNAGLIYGMPQPGDKAGGKVIDLTEGSSYLRWGDYGGDDGAWQFIGGAPIEPALAQDEWQNLALEVRPDGTSVYLNENFVATIEPGGEGHVALVVSVASVEFKDFVISAPDGGPIEAPGIAGVDEIDYIGFEDSLDDWSLLSGSWTAVDGVLSQANGDAYDQMSHFSTFEQDAYLLQVDLRAKPDSQFSGGLLFNAAGFGERANSHVFDIVEDGTVVRWATYDQNGVFTYLGGVRNGEGFDPDAWHTLAVEVRDGEATFYIDGQRIGSTTGVGSGGYVGLVTSLAAMEFTNFAITPLA